MKKSKVLFAVLVASGLSFFGNVSNSNAQEVSRVFWESADKCTYGCYQPRGDCKSQNPWEQVDC